MEFSLKEKDFTVQVAKKRKIAEPLPKYREISSVKTGWCTSSSHERCPKEIFHQSINMKSICICECHKEK